MIVLVTFVCSSPGWICANKTSQAFRRHGAYGAPCSGGWCWSFPESLGDGRAPALWTRSTWPTAAISQSAASAQRRSTGPGRSGVKHGESGKSGKSMEIPYKNDLKRIKLRFEFEWETNAITGGLNGNIIYKKRIKKGVDAILSIMGDFSTSPV